MLSYHLKTCLKWTYYCKKPTLSYLKYSYTL